MLIMDATQTERFNALLKEWRREGRQIGFPELKQAFQAAMEAEEDPGVEAGGDEDRAVVPVGKGGGR